jgi:membrane-associated tyrosine- and threonine-specific cdc2-inhibitory kinase
LVQFQVSEQLPRSIVQHCDTLRVPLQEIKRLFASRQERAELLQELTTAASIPPHANVVRHIRGWQEAHKLHIQMELCAAGSLDALLKRGDLAAADAGALPEPLLWLILRCAAERSRAAATAARTWMQLDAWHAEHCGRSALRHGIRSTPACSYVCSDAAHGLRHVHAHNVIHLDIKPENIYLHASGTFKLGDFGLAIVAAANSNWEEGDGRYVAPELLRRAGRPTTAADVYSLAASLLQCALGAPPHPVSCVFVACSALARASQPRVRPHSLLVWLRRRGLAACSLQMGVLLPEGCG